MLSRGAAHPVKVNPYIFAGIPRINVKEAVL
jgi:hypothetical protein